MSDTQTILVQTYQCPGCTLGSDISCGSFQQDNFHQGSACSAHVAGTSILGLGLILLGMPKGFNRLGCHTSSQCPVCIWDSFEDFLNLWGDYDNLNVPVWKFLDKNGNTLVRGISPRNNRPFIHIFSGDVRDRISCLEITAADVTEMD